MSNPTAEQEAAAVKMYWSHAGYVDARPLINAIAALIAERDAARAERDALVDPLGIFVGMFTGFWVKDDQWQEDDPRGNYAEDDLEAEKWIDVHGDAVAALRDALAAPPAPEQAKDNA